MMDMVKKVARALVKAKGLDPDRCVYGSGGISYGTPPVITMQCHRVAWQDEIGAARATILAMREPSNAMCFAYSAEEAAQNVSGLVSQDAWQVMIDAALQPAIDGGEG